MNKRIVALGFKRTMAAAVAAFALCGAAQVMAAQTITGAGSTFAYPVLLLWSSSYARQTDVELNYQPIGSGGGIKQIEAKTVDFGASDAPMKPSQLEENGLMQWPVIMGGVVPVVNISGIGANQMVLDGTLLAGIYLGKITSWNDPRIKALNPDLNLPAARISVVHRADASGTTWIFTSYLTKASPDWASKVGNGKAVTWPTGLQGNGNEGVAAFVGRVPNSIGYEEYAYALQNHMASVKLKNRDGHVVAPSIDNFAAAAAGADWKHAPGFYVVVTNQPGADSWPITGATFILMHKHPQSPAEARAVLQFLHWSYKNGVSSARSLDYVPIPGTVVKMIEGKWHSELKADGHSIW